MPTGRCSFATANNNSILWRAADKHVLPLCHTDVSSRLFQPATDRLHHAGIRYGIQASLPVLLPVVQASEPAGVTLAVTAANTDGAQGETV